MGYRTCRPAECSGYAEGCRLSGAGNQYGSLYEGAWHDSRVYGRFPRIVHQPEKPSDEFSAYRSRTSRQPAGPNRPKSVLQVSRQTLTFRPATWQHVLSAYDRNSGKVSATSDGTRGSVSASAAPAIRHNAAAKGETQPADFRPHGLKISVNERRNFPAGINAFCRGASFSACRRPPSSSSCACPRTA